MDMNTNGNELLSEWQYLRKIKERAQEIYNRSDYSEDFHFTMSHVCAIFKAIEEEDAERSLKINKIELS